MRAAAGDGNRAAVGFMVLGVASLSFMDALGKAVAARYPVFEMLAIRSTVALALLTLLLATRRRLGTLRTRQPGGHAFRSVCGLVAFVSFYAALRDLPLADAVAIAFGSPFLVTALARVVLKERVGFQRWAAIVVGFLGMLVVVRPEGTLRPAAALIFLSALAYASMMLLARWMTRPERPHEETTSFVFYMLAGQTALGWLIAAGDWRPPDTKALAQMAAMGVFAILGNYGLAEAFRRAQVAVVAPFEYTALIWAVLLGALVFGDVPPPIFWVGTAIIVAAGLFTLRGEGDAVKVPAAAPSWPEAP
jgi:drug/metabolite transporter (DMT)-like permease